MPRYEVPAVIVLDADDETDAHMKALALGSTLDKEEGPGAFFHRITTAVVAWPIEIGDFPREKERSKLSVGEHAESLQSSKGMA